LGWKAKAGLGKIYSGHVMPRVLRLDFVHLLSFASNYYVVCAITILSNRMYYFGLYGLSHQRIVPVMRVLLTLCFVTLWRTMLEGISISYEPFPQSTASFPSSPCLICHSCIPFFISIIKASSQLVPRSPSFFCADVSNPKRNGKSII
jgi:hypothetical protein